MSVKDSIVIIITIIVNNNNRYSRLVIQTEIDAYKYNLFVRAVHAT